MVYNKCIVVIESKDGLERIADILNQSSLTCDLNGDVSYKKFRYDKGCIVKLNEIRELEQVLKIEDIKVVLTGKLNDEQTIKDIQIIELSYPKSKQKRIEDFDKRFFALVKQFCNVDLEENENSSKKKKNKVQIPVQQRKYIICDYGDTEIGKSTTLNEVIDLLEISNNAVRNKPIELIYDGATNQYTDRYAEYEVNGVKISVCTQGDPGLDQLKFIQKATRNKIDVIVCAARDDRKGVSDASTVENVYNGTGNYVKVWYRNFFISRSETNISQQSIDMLSKCMCDTSAKGIIKLIEQIKGIQI